jgi:8-oxo-dGTP pyrophosphatase MutT (NUDIX family)
MDLHRIKNILLQEHTLNDSEWKGAVLFLCNKESVFLIKRSEKMPTHGGQIAFVGGHKKVGEKDPWIVAQREFEEETNHSASILNFLGFLPVTMTARMQPIVPVVAELNLTTMDFLKDVKSNGEWDDIIAYPWAELTQEEKWEFAWRNGFGRSAVMFHPISPGTYIAAEPPIKPYLLWGATAGMIWDFLHLYFED